MCTKFLRMSTVMDPSDGILYQNYRLSNLNGKTLTREEKEWISTQINDKIDTPAYYAKRYGLKVNTLRK